MKNLILLFFLLTLLNEITAQWIPMTSVTHSLTDVFFVDENNGVAVGSTGSIFQTTDSGVTWLPKNSGTINQLNAVHFMSDKVGIAVGEHGTIIKTTDGGNNWVGKPSPTTGFLLSVSFCDATNGYITGQDGIILRTGNGGETWLPQASGVPYELMSCAAVLPFLCYAVGPDGTILKTTTGGTNWVQQNIATFYDLHAVSFLNYNIGMAVGEQGTILKTTNGGITWNLLNSGPYSLSNLFIINANQIVVVGEFGKILRTEDGGAKWIIQESSTDTTRLSSVFFTDPLKGIIVGHQGTILKTVDGGTPKTKPSCKIVYPYIDEECIYTEMCRGLPWAWYFPAAGTATAISGRYIKQVQVKIDDDIWKDALPGEGGSFDTWSFPADVSLFPSPYGKHKIYARAKDNLDEWSNVIFNDFLVGFFRDSEEYPKLEALVEGSICKGTEFCLDINLYANFNIFIYYTSFELNYTNPEFLNYLTYEKRFSDTVASTTVIPDSLEGKISIAMFYVDDLYHAGFDGGLVRLKFRLANNAEPGKPIVFYFKGAENYLGLYSRAYVTDKIVQWPGDANNNGIVEITDINEIVKYWNNTGIPLPGMSSWQGYTRTVWDNYPEATFRDCDGNGLVNIKDVDKVIAYFGYNHDSPYNNPVSFTSQDPPLSVNGPPENLKGQEIYYDVNIGNPDKQVDKLNVVSFELLYNKETLEYIGNENGSFLTESDKLVINDQEKGKLNTSVYKINGGNSGYGNIIRFKFSVKESNSVDLKFNNVLANRTDGTVQPLSPVNFNTVVTVENPVVVPTNYNLSQNYPNPFNPITIIKYELPEDGYITIQIFNALGAEISTLINENKLAGSYEISYNAINLPSGVYFYTMRANKYISTKKMLILK